jgi:hypothetical protein
MNTSQLIPIYPRRLESSRLPSYRDDAVSWISLVALVSLIVFLCIR